MIQTDVLATAMLTATGQLQEATGTNNIEGARIKGAHYTASVAGSIVLREGGATGNIRATIPIGATTTNILIPGEGILFRNNVHCTVVGATLTGITFFYG